MVLRDDVYKDNQVSIYKHTDLFKRTQDRIRWVNGKGTAFVNVEQLVHYKSPHRMLQRFIRKVQEGEGARVLSSMAAGASQTFDSAVQVRNAAQSQRLCKNMVQLEYKISEAKRLQLDLIT